MGALPHFDLHRWAAPYFPAGRGKASSALVELPFALWLYLGIEQLPLAAEESHDPKRDMPRGILYGLVTLIAVSFLTVVLSVGIAPGAAADREIERAAVPRLSDHLRAGDAERACWR